MVAENWYGYSQGWTWLPAEAGMYITDSMAALETVSGLCPLHLMLGLQLIGKEVQVFSDNSHVQAIA
jgi:hypothetical protein